jgi:hypothetical protein
MYYFVPIVPAFSSTFNLYLITLCIIALWCVSYDLPSITLSYTLFLLNQTTSHLQALPGDYAFHHTPFHSTICSLLRYLACTLLCPFIFHTLFPCTIHTLWYVYCTIFHLSHEYFGRMLIYDGFLIC